MKCLYLYSQKFNLLCFFRIFKIFKNYLFNLKSMKNMNLKNLKNMKNFNYFKRCVGYNILYRRIKNMSKIMINENKDLKKF